MAGLWRRLFGRSERDALAPLYRAIVAAARRPVWYRAGGVPDTLDGRFDMVAAILSLVLIRLEAEGEPARATLAHLTELFVSDMDGQLRQDGIGDVVVGKHIGRMMGALGGRLGAFRAAFSGGEGLDAAIERNIYRGVVAAPGAAAIVRDGLVALHATLGATPAAELLDGPGMTARPELSRPEFSRSVRVDTLGVEPRPMRIEADADERGALAARFGLIAIERLEAAVSLSGDGATVTCEGRVEAAVVQPCIASGEPVAAAIDEPFHLRFVPEAEGGEQEVELEADDLDTIAYAGASIDLGEAVAQTLGLALDPFPRAPNADAGLREAGVIAEEDMGPFGALKALRRPIVAIPSS